MAAVGWLIRALKRKPLHPALSLSIPGSLRDYPRTFTAAGRVVYDMRSLNVKESQVKFGGLHSLNR